LESITYRGPDAKGFLKAAQLGTSGPDGELFCPPELSYALLTVLSLRLPSTGAAPFLLTGLLMEGLEYWLSTNF
jgi:hypothetical protein